MQEGSETSRPVAVFFDIDGTLLNVNGAGRRAFSRAIAAVFGWHDTLDHIQFAGATDLAVLHRIAEMQKATITPDQVAAFFDRMPVELEHTARHAQPSVFPGVQELIARLSEHEDVLLGLITGNEERCAQIKLALFGLDHYFQCGAYGNEHADRLDIAQLAERRMAEHLGPDEQPRSYLVGDTPSDIVAAHAIGATAIAVTTGAYGRDALLEAGAHHVVDTLDDTARIFGLLGL